MDLRVLMRWSDRRGKAMRVNNKVDYYSGPTISVSKALVVYVAMTIALSIWTTVSVGASIIVESISRLFC